MHVIISARARRDLGEIWDFLAIRSVEAADRVTNELIERALAIASSPHVPAIVPGREKQETRRVTVRSWVIFYEIPSDHVEVIRILQGRGNPNRLRT